jgi:hypothetical protein
MRSCLETSTPGQKGEKGQTRGPALTRVTDEREETKESSRCFFNDLWRLTQDRGRGSPSKEYVESVRTHDLLVVSYVTLHDVSSNPTVVEGESM